VLNCVVHPVSVESIDADWFTKDIVPNVTPLRLTLTSISPLVFATALVLIILELYPICLYPFEPAVINVSSV